MTLAPAPLGGSRWHTFPEHGTLTARRFATAAEPLLQGVIDAGALGPADLPVLDEQIHATLALGTRETALPLTPGPDSPRATRELAAQARAIGREIAAWSTAALRRLLTDPVPLPAGPLVVRSHCYGHLLTPAAADLLLRHRGGPVTMQLYNEWLHQMVLLRDALLPFTNWQDVPVLIGPTGLRHTEDGRDTFLTELLVRQIRHSGIVAHARRTLTGTAGPAGYGFDHDGGTVLPAVLDSPPATAPRYLLTWRPDPAVRHTATYLPDPADYDAAPRTPLDQLPPHTPATAPRTLTGRVTAGPVHDGVRTARIAVTHDGTTAHADLGQALRGHRFAHRRTPGPTGTAPRPVAAWDLLRAPQLVQAGDTGGTVDTTGLDGLTVLALLGRSYPRAVVLRPDGLTLGATGRSR